LLLERSKSRGAEGDNASDDEAVLETIAELDLTDLPEPT
jgi:hypothetical protein